MELLENNIVHVPFRRMEGAKPSECFNNAAMVADKHGGRPIWGWSVSDKKVLWRLIPHAIWEDAEGDWWEVTPFRSQNVWGEEELVACGRDFLAENDVDETHKSLPSKFIPRIPAAVDACKYLNTAVSCTGGRDRAIYWHRRAERFLAKHDVDLTLIGSNDGTFDYITSTPNHARKLESVETYANPF